MTRQRPRIPDVGLALGAIAIALPWADLETGSLLAFARGSALLAFWLLTSARVGRLAARFPDDGDGIALRSFVYAYLYVLLSVLMAGLVHRIDLLSLTVSNAACFLVASAYRSRPPGPTPPDRTRLQEFVRREPLGAIVLGLLGSIAVIHTAWALLAPVSHPDDFTYHLVFAVEWAQDKTLSHKLIPFGNHAPAYHPKNTEMLFTWLFLPLRSFAHLAFAQVTFVLATVGATCDILRRCGAPRSTSWMVAMLYWSSPVTLRYLSGGYVDLAFACLFVLAVRALVILRQRPRLSGWVDLSIIIGLLVGTKSFGILLTLLVLLPFGVLLLSSQWRSLIALPPGRVLGSLSVMGCLSVVGGGWWQLRNLIETGNPLFPVQVELFGFPLFSGAYARSALGAADASRLVELLGRPVWLLIAVAAAWTTVSTLARRGGALRVTWIAAMAIVVPALLALVYWKLMPTGYPRFVLAAVPLATLVLAPPLAAAGWPGRVTRLLLLTAVLILAWKLPILIPPSTVGLATTPFVRTAFVASVVGLVGLVCLVPAAQSRRGLVALVALVPAVGMLWLGTRTSDPEGDHLTKTLQRAWQPYLRIRQDHGSARIAVTGNNATLYAYGRDYSNPVEYVNVNSTGRALFHEHFRPLERFAQTHRDDPSGVAYYRRDGNYDDWIRNLTEFDPDLLIVSRMPSWALKRDYVRDGSGFPVERQWADRHPQRFERFLVSGNMRVYRVVD